MTTDTGSGLLVSQEGKYSSIVVCWLLGAGSLFAWNSLLTIEDYYVHIFPSYHPTRVLSIVYQVVAFLTSAILTYYEARLNTRTRNLAGFSLFLIGSAFLIVLDVATSGRGGIAPFIGVCIITGAYGFADANIQGGMVGDLSLMCPEFIQSYFAGIPASGALISTLRFMTKAAFENSKDGLRKGAILFFALSTFFELLCVLLYGITFPKLPIVKYYRSKAAAEGSKTVSADLIAGGIQKHNQEIGVSFDGSMVEEDPKHLERLSTKELLLRNWDYAFDLYMLHVLTLSIFPGFLSEDTGSHSLASWYALVLIATYNVWDLVGRYTPLIKFLRITLRKGIMVAVLSRFLFVPAFYFTAKYGDQGWMIILTSFFGITNGHLTVCIMMAAPKGYKGPEQNAIGNLLVTFIIMGIFTGVTLDWLWLIGKGW